MWEGGGSDGCGRSSDVRKRGKLAKHNREFDGEFLTQTPDGESTVAERGLQAQFMEQKESKEEKKTRTKEKQYGSGRKENSREYKGRKMGGCQG